MSSLESEEHALNWPCDYGALPQSQIDSPRLWIFRAVCAGFFF